MVTNLVQLLDELSRERSIFHSEADFQQALAWALHRQLPDAKVRVEYKPFPDERFYVDIWLVTYSITIAIELKYLTRQFRAELKDEQYWLSSHGA